MSALSEFGGKVDQLSREFPDEFSACAHGIFFFVVGMIACGGFFAGVIVGFFAMAITWLGIRAKAIHLLLEDLKDKFAPAPRKRCEGGCADCKCKNPAGELSPSEYELFVNREGNLVKPVGHGPDKCGCNGQTQCAERLREQGIVVGEKKDCGGNCADCPDSACGIEDPRFDEPNRDKCKGAEEEPPAGLLISEDGLCEECKGLVFTQVVKGCPECNERSTNSAWKRCSVCAIVKNKCSNCDGELWEDHEGSCACSYDDGATCSCRNKPGEVFATGARDPRAPGTREKVAGINRCGCGNDCADLGCPGRRENEVGGVAPKTVEVARAPFGAGYCQQCGGFDYGHHDGCNRAQKPKDEVAKTVVTPPSDVAFYESDPLSCIFCDESDGRHKVSCRLYVNPSNASDPAEKKLDKLTDGLFKTCDQCGLYEKVHATWCDKRDPKTDSTAKVACLKCGRVDGHYEGCLTSAWINSPEGRLYAEEKDKESANPLSEEAFSASLKARLEKRVIDLVAMSGICSVCRGENGGHKPNCALRDCQRADYVGPTVPEEPPHPPCEVGCSGPGPVTDGSVPDGGWWVRANHEPNCNYALNGFGSRCSCGLLERAPNSKCRGKCDRRHRPEAKCRCDEIELFDRH